MSLRVVFMGTPVFAVATLEAIVAQGHEIVAVYTREPKPAGRGMALTPSPVHAAAERHGLSVLTPKSLRSTQAAEAFAAHDADVAVVVAYGLILPKPVLDAPRLGCLNLHASLLPRWRGAAPIQRAVMAGDAESGVMVMRMEEGLDTGPVGLIERLAIGAEMTAGELHDALMPLGAELMGRALAALAKGTLVFTPQAEEGVTYAAKIGKAEARIDWSQPGPVVHDHIRGLSPFPGAYFELAGEAGSIRVKVLRSAIGGGTGTPGAVLEAEGLAVACGTGAVRLVTLQRAGKGPMAAAEFLRGNPLPPGTSLT